MSSSSTVPKVTNLEGKALLASVVSDDGYAVGEASSTSALLKPSNDTAFSANAPVRAVSSQQQFNYSTFDPLLALATVVANESLKPITKEIPIIKQQHTKPIYKAQYKKAKTENTTLKRKMTLPTKKTRVYKKRVPKIAKKESPKKIAAREIKEFVSDDDSDSQFPPRIIERTWNKNYQDLVQYHAKNGNSNVLRSDPNKQLSGWVKRQRNNLKDGKLSPNKIILLNELDFVWNRTDGAWYKKFCQLVVFEQKFGHSYVTARYDRSLAEWCQRQRREYKNDPTKMPGERVQKLEALNGWSWDKRKEMRALSKQGLWKESDEKSGTRKQK